VSKVQETITRSVDESMTKKQRQYLLQEQLKTIKRELVDHTSTTRKPHRDPTPAMAT
jgi:ATP-dependent Lon protease